MIRLNIPSSKGESFGPKTTAFHIRKLFAIGAADISSGFSSCKIFKSLFNLFQIFVQSNSIGDKMQRSLFVYFHLHVAPSLDSICLLSAWSLSYISTETVSRNSLTGGRSMVLSGEVCFVQDCKVGLDKFSASVFQFPSSRRRLP